MQFRHFVLKVHSRCNLACDHCYMYEAVDQNWRAQPKFMSAETVAATADNIAGYAARNELDAIQVILHGGEPLLLRPDRLARVITRLERSIGAVTTLRLSMQTNGVLLDERYADVLREHGVRTGISLDGGREANDRHRLYRRGASSYDDVVRGVELLNRPEYRSIFAGLLCTVDVRNDPVGVFEELARLRPPAINFLLPHATHQFPPPNTGAGAARYGRWLAAAFDHWFDAPPEIGVRFFQELANALLGGASHSEAVGLAMPSTVVVETDGSYEQTDALKVAYPGAASTGLNVREHRIEQVFADPEMFGNSSRLQDLSAACQACPVVRVCGGGLFPHRYKPGAGFRNPSVYCEDLKYLVEHVDGRLTKAPVPLRTILPAGENNPGDHNEAFVTV